MFVPPEIIAPFSRPATTRLSFRVNQPLDCTLAIVRSHLAHPVKEAHFYYSVMAPLRPIKSFPSLFAFLNGSKDDFAVWSYQAHDLAPQSPLPRRNYRCVYHNMRQNPFQLQS
jgi:hypothetical protein